MNTDEPLRTKNLAEEDPAPMDDTLGGYPWLPRMSDKARASRAGTIGSYYKYPCPIDRACLSALNITATQFERAAVSSKYGYELLAALSRLDASLSSAKRFDPLELNRRLHDQSS